MSRVKTWATTLSFSLLTLSQKIKPSQRLKVRSIGTTHILRWPRGTIPRDTMIIYPLRVLQTRTCMEPLRTMGWYTNRVACLFPTWARWTIQWSLLSKSHQNSQKWTGIEPLRIRATTGAGWWTNSCKIPLETRRMRTQTMSHQASSQSDHRSHMSRQLCHPTLTNASSWTNKDSTHPWRSQNFNQSTWTTGTSLRSNC